MYERIIVATDSSAEARAAVAHAVELAAAVDASLHIVTVLDIRGNPMQFGIGEVDALNEAASELLEELIAAHRDRDIDITGQILRGKPAETILDYAEEIDANVVIVGQRGADGLTGTLIGSTTDRLARLTDRPLIVVPADD